MCFLAVKTSLFSCSSTRTSSSILVVRGGELSDCQRRCPEKQKKCPHDQKKGRPFEKQKASLLVVREKNKSAFKRRFCCARVSSLFPLRLTNSLDDETFFSPFRPAICEREELLSKSSKSAEKERERGQRRYTKGVCRFFFCLRKICTRERALWGR